MTKLMLAALAATTAIATPAMANTDTTTVWASIAPICSIDAPADNGSIALSGSTSLGNITVTCNDPAGFTVNMYSANSGKLADSSGGGSTTTFAYNLNFGAVGTQELTSPVSFNSSVYGSAAAAAAIPGVSLPVTLNVTAQNGPSFAGTYSDVITWTITAN